jgi:hypothetical protein
MSLAGNLQGSGCRSYGSKATCSGSRQRCRWPTRGFVPRKWMRPIFDFSASSWALRATFQTEAPSFIPVGLGGGSGSDGKLLVHFTDEDVTVQASPGDNLLEVCVPWHGHRTLEACRNELPPWVLVVVACLLRVGSHVLLRLLSLSVSCTSKPTVHSKYAHKASPAHRVPGGGIMWCADRGGLPCWQLWAL